MAKHEDGSDKVKEHEGNFQIPAHKSLRKEIAWNYAKPSYVHEGRQCSCTRWALIEVI